MLSFFKRIGYSIRKVAYEGQELKKNSKDLTLKFFTFIYSIRKDLFILDKLDLIGDVDETAIYFENKYNTTVQKIGEKSVKVRTFGKDKFRISAVLAILANKFKLPLLQIFCGKTGGPN